MVLVESAASDEFEVDLDDLVQRVDEYMVVTNSDVYVDTVELCWCNDNNVQNIDFESDNRCDAADDIDWCRQRLTALKMMMRL